ncbi:TSUP family transporter [Rufibacter latericius]|uniref:Probable membrane transporter protein n=1 Tax=Rufibacter latericius TaxID=2487040 RepID=A0A3M9N120_9BACT|nr:TSUP family transporter [Rufibacter latericius]RNI31494.1 ABC transporter permease [Rufibacter latericius]
MISAVATKEQNNLFPVFLKLEQMRVLVVGGGNIGLEKLTALLQNSPKTTIKVVAIQFHESVLQLASEHGNITLEAKAFTPSDLDGIDIVIVAVNDREVSRAISLEAKHQGKLVNVADTPDLCDFYLSSVVRKGNLKIAISTNGKSPTMAKRLKETFNETLPEELDEVLDNLQSIRNQLAGDFSAKVTQLNDITKVLAVKEPVRNSPKRKEKPWKLIASGAALAFFFMILGRFVFSAITFSEVSTFVGNIEPIFYWMIFAGFLAQMVDGALGMGYGVTSTTVLLSLGVNLPAISGSIHTAEIFSSGISGFSHYKFGNVNRKLFKVLLVPGILGAVAGAWLLSEIGEEYANYVRPILAAYTLVLGARIIYTAFKKNKERKKIKMAGVLAGAGGFLDSFGGGGWGPLVTSTLIAKGRTPRFVIGTVSITEFFVTFASALTFFAMLGLSHLQVIVGLVIGGMLAAPIAARLVGKLPMKTMFIAVGTLVIIWSLRILLKAAGLF